MPIHHWIEPDRRTTPRAVRYPLTADVLLRKPTKMVRDTVGDLLLQERI
jgi:hypothetical protein